MRITTAFLFSVLIGCGGIDPPTEPPEPPCEGLGVPWCHEVNPPMTCGECKHQPPGEDCPIMAPPCEPPPLPQPQCSTFTDRGGTLQLQADECDCYREEVWIPCSTPPPGECCHPDANEGGGVWKAFPASQYPAEDYDSYRKATIAVGDRCGEDPEETLALIAEELREMGKCAVGPAADSVSIKRDDGRYEEWHAVYYGNGCIIDGPNAHKATWEYSGDQCLDPTEPPPTGECPAPHPDLTDMKFGTKEAGNHLDTTWKTIYQPEYCAEIGFCCMPGTGTPENTCDSQGCVPRGGCPVRPECGPDSPPDAICHDRAACEAELCDQKWECNGVPVEGWRGNPAQTDCSGHWKTWCSAPGSTAVAEGNR